MYLFLIKKQIIVSLLSLFYFLLSTYYDLKIKISSTFTFRIFNIFQRTGNQIRVQ